MIHNDLHLARLEPPLKELEIFLALSLEGIVAIQAELIVRNALQDGTVCLQVSRGEAGRGFFYSNTMAPTLVGFTQAMPLVGTKAQQRGRGSGLGTH